MLAIGKLIIHYTLAMMLVSIPVGVVSADNQYEADDLYLSVSSGRTYNGDEMSINGLCHGDDASQCCCIIDIPGIVQSKSAVLDDLFITRFVPYYPVRLAGYVSTRLLRPPITQV